MNSHTRRNPWSQHRIFIGISCAELQQVSTKKICLCQSICCTQQLLQSFHSRHCCQLARCSANLVFFFCLFCSMNSNETVSEAQTPFHDESRLTSPVWKSLKYWGVLFTDKNVEARASWQQAQQADECCLVWSNPKQKQSIIESFFFVEAQVTCCPVLECCCLSKQKRERKKPFPSVRQMMQNNSKRP